MEQNFDPLKRKLDDLLSVIESLLSRKTWQRRPL